MRKPFLSDHWHRVADLRPQLRAHVPVVRHRVRGQAWYVIQDMASGRFHRFTPAVYMVIGSMNGRRTVDEIWQASLERLKDDAPSQTEIVDLLSRLHAADLIRSDISSDAAELFERYQTQSRQQFRSQFANPMSIRLPLLNPDRFLAATLPLVRPLFSRGGLALWLFAVAVALVLASLHWSELTDNVSDRVMGLDNVLLMAALFPVLKILHELGHGYACRRYGGEVRQAGIMFLIFAPVPYVDASASIAFRSRRQRIIVAAAGMLVENFIAAFAVMLWVAVEPGLVRTLAFNTIIIAGVSTVLFNINPLMRLDGYFILCDPIDCPNLGQRASRFWGDWAERRLFAVDAEPQQLDRDEAAWFVFYAPASLVYRLLVMIGIAFFIANTYFVAGVVLACLSVVTTLVLPLLKIARHVLIAPRLAEQRRRAVLITFGGAAAFIAIILGVPLPLHTLSEGVVWLPETAMLRMAEDGFVDRVIGKSGTTTEPGDIILTALEPNLAGDAVVTGAQIEALTLRFDAERLSDRVLSEVTRTDLQLKSETLQQQNSRLEHLTLASSQSGRLILPQQNDLPGRFVKRGEVVGFVLPAQSRTIRVAVSQADIDLVRQRLKGIDVMLAGRSGETLAASLERQVPAASMQLPSRALSIEGGGRIAVDARDQKNPRSLEGVFLFDVRVAEDRSTPDFGARAWVRFDHGVEPLGFQWWRRLRQLFLSRLET